MPFFRIDRELHFFAHVPKCAGASVEVYLRKRFGEIAFANSQFYNVPEAQRWTKSSPQHMDIEALGRLVPPGWITSSFAVVRHPVTRLRSAYDYQLTGEKTVPEGMDINAWFLDWVAQRDEMPFRYDNHPRPAADLVPPGATVFRLEDGLQGVVAHLDGLAGNSDGPRKLPHENKSRGGVSYAAGQAPLSDEALGVMEKVYATDFARFGYTCEDVTKGAKPRNDLPRQRMPWLNRLLGR
ncbi:MAG: sulfotransferase family 2 domain-containing protein [Roseovarius sp.]